MSPYLAWGREPNRRGIFKQKTAYEINFCLVGSEMCIRDRTGPAGTIRNGGPRISKPPPSASRPRLQLGKSNSWSLPRWEALSKHVGVDYAAQVKNWT